MAELTETQLRALRWLEENDQTRSSWTFHGKPPKPKQEWTHLMVSGPTDSVIIAEADLRALDPYHEISPDRRKFFRANSLGLKALGLSQREAA